MMIVLPGVPSAQGPVHGVALVEAGAEHDQHIQRIAEDRRRRMAGAGIAEHAEGKRVVLREYAFGAQGGRHRDRPPFGDRFEKRRGIVVLDAGAGEERDPRAAAQEFEGGDRSRRAQRGNRLEVWRDRRVVRGNVAEEGVVRQ